MAVVGATAGVSAWLVKPVLDDIFIRHDAWKLRVLPAAILGLYLVKGVCRYLQSYLMRWVGEAVVHDPNVGTYVLEIPRFPLE